MSKNINNIWQRLCQHKYLWAILLFVLIAGFIDENSLYRYFLMGQHNRQLHNEIAEYEREYNEAQSELNRLSRSPHAFEEVARVHLFMKSADEDVYVIE
ncbi:MAG: septum formation initiator family protein [Bacteroidaceae bacterium]|nr:septum formation initiator family protein [Bacteroidaceae bacterium]